MEKIVWTKVEVELEPIWVLRYHWRKEWADDDSFRLQNQDFVSLLPPFLWETCVDDRHQSEPIEHVLDDLKKEQLW